MSREGLGFRSPGRGLGVWGFVIFRATANTSSRVLGWCLTTPNAQVLQIRTMRRRKRIALVASPSPWAAIPASVIVLVLDRDMRMLRNVRCIYPAVRPKPRQTRLPPLRLLQGALSMSHGACLGFRSSAAPYWHS